MDIHIEIDEQGRVAFSDCPEEVLEVALGLNPHDAVLQWRARRLQSPDAGLAEEGPNGEAARGSEMRGPHPARLGEPVAGRMLAARCASASHSAPPTAKSERTAFS